MAKKSGYHWDITAEEFEELAGLPCADCETTPCRGIYRKDLTGAFTLDNCVSLCAECGRKRPKRARVDKKSSPSKPTVVPEQRVERKHTAGTEATLEALANYVHDIYRREMAQPQVQVVLCPIPMNDAFMAKMFDHMATTTTPNPYVEQLISNIVIDIPDTVLDDVRQQLEAEQCSNSS
jgi:hypothetical protein